MNNYVIWAASNANHCTSTRQWDKAYKMSSSALAYEAFQVYGPKLGVRSFYEFQLNCWPQLQSAYEHQVSVSSQTPARLFPNAKTAEEQLNALRADHLNRALLGLSQDLWKLEERKRNGKMCSFEFVTNYVTSACEAPRGKQSVAQILNDIGVEDVRGFQEACIAQISTAIHKNWNQYYGKRMPKFDQGKFNRFFTKKFNAAIDAQSFAAANEPAVEWTEKKYRQPTDVPVVLAKETFEFEEIAPLEPASTVDGGWHRRKSKKDEEDDEEFGRNLVTWSDLFGIPEAEMLTTDPEFKHRLALHMADESISYDSRYSEWLRRQKDRVKDRYHKRHPHADNKKVVKEAKKMRKAERKANQGRATPPPPGGPPGTMPREEMGSVPPMQAMIEGRHHGHASQTKHYKPSSKHDPRYSFSGSFEDELTRADSRAASPVAAAAAPHFMTFEELAKKTAVSANLVPHASAATLTQPHSLADRFLAEFLNRHGHNLVGRKLIFLAPSDQRLQRSPAQFKAFEQSMSAQDSLVATHLFEACDSVPNSTLEPVFKQGRPVVVSSDRTLVTHQGLGAQLGELVGCRHCKKHNVEVSIYEHDSLLSMSQQ